MVENTKKTKKRKWKEREEGGGAMPRGRYEEERRRRGGGGGGKACKFGEGRVQEEEEKMTAWQILIIFKTCISL